jgi:hypothetical protein
VVVGGGLAGMTAALLLARRGHQVAIFEREDGLGGLWSSRLDAEGYFRSDNSCKVFQPSYVSTPGLFRLTGTDWRAHFTRRHDLTSDWLRPFVADCTWRDLGIFGASYALYRVGGGQFHQVTVAEFMDRWGLSEDCRGWMRATALGGIAGTLRMTMWEFFLRIGSNFPELWRGVEGPLFWNSQPPSGPKSFVPFWRRALHEHGVQVHTGSSVTSLSLRQDPDGVTLTTQSGAQIRADAVFLALPPPALAGLLDASPDSISEGFGLPPIEMGQYLKESAYSHVGVTWFFDRKFSSDLPLGGHNVRRGWHPILVQHDQYGDALRPPARGVVVGSVAVDTKFRHHRLGSKAREHSLDEIAAILRDDERRADPDLPEPIDVVVADTSSATQIVRRGPLPISMNGANVYLATNLHGQAPYFTASLKTAIQAGAIAAQRFDPSIEQIPMGPPNRLPWKAPQERQRVLGWSRASNLAPGIRAAD